MPARPAATSRLNPRRRRIARARRPISAGSGVLVIMGSLPDHGNAVLAWLTGPPPVHHSPTQPNVEREMVFSLPQSVSESGSAWGDRQVSSADDIRWDLD